MLGRSKKDKSKMSEEQKHKEDLEAAKGWLAIAKENNNTIAIQILENLFPELRESEDERIRKEIIAYLNVQESLVQSKDDVFKEWIAWLEKQKRNKTIKFSEEDEKTRLWIIHVLCECGYKFNDNGERENAFELLEKIKQIICSDSLEKQGEQKPADKIEQKPSWSEEDNKNLNSVKWIIENSENLNRVFETIDSPEYIKKYFIDWLNSLKDRVQPQPKQEWSEDDEHCIELLLPIIDSSSLIPKNRKKCKEFLKSLKSSHWKPSEE